MPTWKLYRDVVMQIFVDVQPYLYEYWLDRTNKVYNFTMLTQRGIAKTKERHAKKRLSKDLEEANIAPLAQPKRRQDKRAADVAERNEKKGFTDAA